MQNCDPPAVDLDPATLVAIVAAANPRTALSDQTIEALRGWLAQSMTLAIRRARATPLGKGDVDRLEAAYLRFRNVIDDLQDRDDPPPLIPVADGSTDWEHWLIGHQHFGFKRGRKASSDWRLVGALLALYEALSGKRASAAQANGPTMRFLETALHTLADHAPAETHSNLGPPTADALKQQLPHLRDFAMRQAARQLSKFVGPAGQ